jgi:ubiquinone/menaquinone biosynthesis C-methylase UbiE
MSQRGGNSGSYSASLECLGENMAQRVCPFWIGYLLLLPIRKLWQNPEKILSPYVKEGMTVLDVGSAMGYFSIPLARMVGARGKVVCVDMQEKMLAVLRKRAAKAGVSDRIETHVCGQNSLQLEKFAESVDFALAFAMVHEVPDSRKLFQEIAAALKPRARLLVAEPRGHVKDKDFAETLCIAGQSGFQVVGEPPIARSHTALLEKL